MDSAILPTAAGLLGSIIGASATFSASWLTQRRHLRMQALVEQAAKRETVYSEFIAEASKRIAESWSQQTQNPEVLAQLYAALERMRLSSSAAVVGAAEAVILFVADSYEAPNRSFADLRQSLHAHEFPDPLQSFTQACRTELAALRR